jgi:hypothetical protein
MGRIFGFDARDMTDLGVGALLHDIGKQELPLRVRHHDASFTAGPFERRMRDLRTLLQQAQGRKAHLQDAGAFILGLDANLAFA